MTQWYTEACLHCGKQTKHGRFDDHRPIYICDSCYDYHNYAEMEANL